MGVCGEDNGGRKELQRTYARYDFIVVCEVGFAVFAAVDSFGGQVDVVGEAHVIGSAVSGTATWPGPSRLSVRLDFSALLFRVTPAAVGSQLGPVSSSCCSLSSFVWGLGED